MFKVIDGLELYTFVSCLQERAMEQIDECERILSLSGEAILNKKSYINNVVPEFARAFERTLDGRRPTLDNKPLYVTW